MWALPDFGAFGHRRRHETQVAAGVCAARESDKERIATIIGRSRRPNRQLRSANKAAEVERAVTKLEVRSDCPG